MLHSKLCYVLRPVNLTFRIFIQVDWDKDPLIYIVLVLGKLKPGNDCERTLIHYKSSMYLQTKTICMCPKTGRPVFGVLESCPVVKTSGFQTFFFSLA